jgi:DNA-binding NarL/FixJ family response regulator
MRRAVRSLNSVTVHLAARDVLTIAGLRQLLHPCAFISVTGSSAEDDATIAALASTCPDVLVLSVSEEDGLHTLARSARDSCPNLKIVLLTDEDLAISLMAASTTRLEAVLIRGGDYLEDIGAILRIVHRGGRVTSGYQAVTTDSADLSVTPQLAARVKSLSLRETIVLRELARGCTNAQIALPLHLSVATIKADLAHIMSVTGASGRVELAVLAVRCGLIDDDESADLVQAPTRRSRPGWSLES